LVALVAVVSGTATFAIATNGDQTFYACLTKGGDLTDVSTEAPPECKGNKAPVSWNAEGPPGPMGPQGPQGPAGPQGATGTVDFYQVTATYETPAHNAPTPPFSYAGEEFSEVFQPDTAYASCDAGDVAVSGVIYRLHGLEDRTTGELLYNNEQAVLALPFPNWPPGLPTGYTVPETDHQISWIRYYKDESNDHDMVELFESQFRVTCAG
jgi:hypothetical protein